MHSPLDHAHAGVHKETGQLRSNLADGTDITLPLPSGNAFGYYAEKDGYVGSSENIDLGDVTEYGEKMSILFCMKSAP